jgi:hypothetical protein
MMIMLTNKSTRVYDTSQGRFHPGTSKEFPEPEAIQLLGYAGEIVRTSDDLGVDTKKVIDKAVAAKVAAKDKEIGNLNGFISKLKTEVSTLTAQLKAAAKPRGPRSK